MLEKNYNRKLLFFFLLPVQNDEFAAEEAAKGGDNDKKGKGKDLKSLQNKKMKRTT